MGYVVGCEGYAGYDGIAITGTKGAGKSTVARTLCNRDSRLHLVRTVTTRTRRRDDLPGELEYVSDEEFRQLSQGRLLIQSRYGGHFYGVARRALQEVLDASGIPVMIVGPGVMRELDNRCGKMGLKLLTIFIDSEDELLDERIVQRDGGVGRQTEDVRRIDRFYDRDCALKVYNSLLGPAVDSICEMWARGKPVRACRVQISSMCR